MESSVTQLQDWFEAAEDATNDARLEGERARDYVDGNQLTDTEITELRKRGQPPVVINRTRRKIEWLLGLEIKQRTDPKAFPRTPQHIQGAEAVTDAIRYVCDDQDWDNARSLAYDNMLVEGYGGAEVVHKQNAKGEIDVVINHYPWDRLFYDPHSRRHDFSDARYKGVVLWMDQADFDKDYPKHKGHIDGLYQEVDSNTYDDRPADKWIDQKRKRVRVVLIWYRKDAKWVWAKFVKGSVLDDGESPYIDEDGQSECPLVLQSLYVGRENERYGLVRDMFDVQDEINKRRSKALHSINSRQTVGIKGAVKSVAELKRELAKPDGHVEVESEVMEEAARVGMKPFDVIQNQDQTAAQFNLLQEAKQEMDLLGANAALEGEGTASSGREVLARQQGGMVEIASNADKLHRFTREIYRHIWMRIRQFWTEERWVRVTDDDNNAKFVGFNRPITLEDQLGQLPPEQATQMALQAGLAPGDPRLQTVVGIDNNVEELDVDIVIEEVPDRVTLEGEMFEALMKYGPTLPPAVLIEADPSLPSKRKEKLLEMLNNTQPSPAEQAELMGKEASANKDMAHAQKLQAEAATVGLA